MKKALLFLIIFTACNLQAQKITEKVGKDFRVVVLQPETGVLDSSGYSAHLVAQIKGLEQRRIELAKHDTLTINEIALLKSQLNTNLGAGTYDKAITNEKKAQLRAFLQGSWILEQTKGTVIDTFNVIITGTAFVSGEIVGSLSFTDDKNCTVTGFFALPLDLKLSRGQLTGKVGLVNYIVKKPNAALANSQVR